MASAAHGGRPSLAQRAGVVWRRLRTRRLGYVRHVVAEVVAGYARTDLLTYATAISLKLLFAFVPFVLFVLGLLGLAGFPQLWSQHIAPTVARQVVGPGFAVIDSSARHVLSRESLFWATFGALLTIWEISGAVRATMGALQRMYGSHPDWSTVRRLLVSTAIAIPVGLLFLLALGVLFLPPLAIPDPTTLGVVILALRWPVAFLLLLAVVCLLMYAAPAKPPSVRAVAVGGTFTVVGWLVVSLVFHWYLTHLAHYDSLFGNVATLIVGLEYLYLSALVFLTGLQVDAVLRLESQSPDEESPGAPTFDAAGTGKDPGDGG